MGRLKGMVAVFLLVTMALVTRPLWAPSAGEGVLVEVVGEVQTPGMHRIDPATIASALAAAGGDPKLGTQAVLHEGDRVVVGAEGLHIAPSGDPLLVALPIDINTADALGLQAVPGIGPALSEAIVNDRAERGPFESIEALERVKGIGPSTRGKIAPFLSVSQP